MGFLVCCAAACSSPSASESGSDDFVDEGEGKAPRVRRDLSDYQCPVVEPAGGGGNTAGGEGGAGFGQPGGVRAAFFDADSTLRVSKIGLVTAGSVDDVNVLPFAAKKIRALNQKGYLVAIVSNQKGVSTGKTTYEVAEGALIQVAKLISRLGARVDYLDFAEGDDEYRKPDIGMARKLDEVLREKCGVGIDIGRSQMVGDSGYKKGEDGPHPDGRPADDFSNADRLFAENLGVPFHEPCDYFGWRKYGETYNIENQDQLEALLGAMSDAAADLRANGSPNKAKALEREVRDNRKVNGLSE